MPLQGFFGLCHGQKSGMLAPADGLAAYGWNRQGSILQRVVLLTIDQTQGLPSPLFLRFAAWHTVCDFARHGVARQSCRVGSAVPAGTRQPVRPQAQEHRRSGFQGFSVSWAQAVASAITCPKQLSGAARLSASRQLRIRPTGVTSCTAYRRGRAGLPGGRRAGRGTWRSGPRRCPRRGQWLRRGAYSPC